jgi:hypothetical protein
LHLKAIDFGRYSIDLPGEFLAALKAVDFYPSIAVAAGYSNPI